jgi:hypothetical protein
MTWRTRRRGGKGRDFQKGNGEFIKVVRKAVEEQKKDAEECEENMMMAVVDDQEDGMKGEYKEKDVPTVSAEVFYDHVNGGELDPDKVREARKEEIRFFIKMIVYEKVPRNRCIRLNKSPIKLRWVDTLKGDGVYRSRLVAKEFKTNSRPDLFSATPPTETLKLILSMTASAQKSKERWGKSTKAESEFRKEDGNDEKVCILHTDISRAYFHAEAKEEKFVEIPNEDWEKGDEKQCARLRVSMYGTRDAALTGKGIHEHSWL